MEGQIDKIPGGLMEEKEANLRSPLVPRPMHHSLSGVISSCCYLHGHTSFMDEHGSGLFDLPETLAKSRYLI